MNKTEHQKDALQLFCPNVNGPARGKIGAGNLVSHGKQRGYARYIEQHGTNQVEVRAHKKHVPMRVDPKAMTKVTAMPPQKEIQEP